MKKSNRYTLLIAFCLLVVTVLGFIITSVIGLDKIAENLKRVNRHGLTMETAITYKGRVREKATEDLPVKGAKVSFVDHREIQPKITNEDGQFSFNIKLKEDKLSAILEVVHDEYEIWREPQVITLNYSDEVPVLLQRKNYPQISGWAIDSQDNKLGEVTISIAEGGNNEKARTASDGRFTLTIKRTAGESVRLQASKSGYKPWEKDIVIPNDKVPILMERN